LPVIVAQQMLEQDIAWISVQKNRDSFVFRIE